MAQPHTTARARSMDGHAPISAAPLGWHSIFRGLMPGPDHTTPTATIHHTNTRQGHNNSSPPIDSISNHTHTKPTKLPTSCTRTMALDVTAPSTNLPTHACVTHAGRDMFFSCQKRPRAPRAHKPCGQMDAAAGVFFTIGMTKSFSAMFLFSHPSVNIQRGCVSKVGVGG